MRPPGPVVDGLAAALAERTGRTPTVVSVTSVGGGCINHASRLRMDRGDDVFLKWNAGAPTDSFVKEARGLDALRGRSALRVPEVLGHSAAADPGPPWLALEYVAPGSPAPDFDALLGSGLAELHRSAGADTFGWEEDNYVGSLPQANAPTNRWPRFWRERRLEPLARRAGGLLTEQDRRDLARLFDHLDDVLAPVQEPPSLLHGDLWSGNVYPGPEGEPVLVDPAVYRGHREVDLAMAHLFGGFRPGFNEAYDHAFPLLPGWPSPRRDVYQLYPLLVHVNLFGSGYLQGMRGALDGALDGIG